MSRLKRQRLTTDGRDRVTARTDEAIHLDVGERPENTGDEPTKQQQGRSLFVRSLPESATTDSLTNLFSQNFPIRHATVVFDTETKKSKGYGFVTFADVEDAQRAKETFDRSLFEGRKIKVDFAEPRHRQANEDGSTAPRKKHIQQQKPESQQPPKLIVRNLPWTVKKPEDLAALFRSYGKVKHVTMPKAKPGLSAGFGFVLLRGRKNAQKAIEGVNGKEVEGRTLAVDWAVEKEVWETLQNGEKQAGVEDSTAHSSTAADDDGNVKSGGSKELPVEAITESEVEPDDDSDNAGDEEDEEDEWSKPHTTQEDFSTLFIRNLPFTTDDEKLKDHFDVFGPVRYARVVLDHATERSKGTGFVAFYNQDDANTCLREAPRLQATAEQTRTNRGTTIKQSILEDIGLDCTGRYTIDGRVLHVSRAVDRKEATRLTVAGTTLRDVRDKDKRRLYLLSEGTVPSGSPLYNQLSATEIKMREDSAKQRQSLTRSNPTLHLSLTRLSVRNLPRSVTSKDLKALAREAVVGFARDVKAGTRRQLSKEELSRGGEEMREAERLRKAKGKGIVKQTKVVFEGREGAKVAEDSGAGRSRGYGFIEYSSHRWALMGLRWLNGHAIGPSKSDSTSSAPAPAAKERKKRLIVEFAIENAQVVGRRQEREAKARERSKLIAEKRAKGELPGKTPKPFTKDQLMAKTRKGTKRKQTSNAAASEQSSATFPTNESDKAAKRQQIIGRKRMLRRSRNKAASII